MLCPVTIDQFANEAGGSVLAKTPSGGDKMQSQSWVFAKSLFLSFSIAVSLFVDKEKTMLYYLFFSTFSYHSSISWHLCLFFFHYFHFHEQWPFPSVTEVLQVLLSVLIFLLVTASFLLFFILYSGYLFHVSGLCQRLCPHQSACLTFHAIIFKSLSLSTTQVLFLVPFCLSSPEGEISFLLSLSLSFFHSIISKSPVGELSSLHFLSPDQPLLSLSLFI